MDIELQRHRHSSASMPDGLAAPSVFNATDQTSGPVICSLWQDGEHGAGSQRRQSWTDQQIWFLGVSVSVVHWCRRLLLSFSICYLGILGLEGAKIAYWLEPLTKGQSPKRGQKLCSQSVLHSEVPLYPRYQINVQTMKVKAKSGEVYFTE